VVANPYKQIPIYTEHVIDMYKGKKKGYGKAKKGIYLDKVIFSFFYRWRKSKERIQRFVPQENHVLFKAF